MKLSSLALLMTVVLLGAIAWIAWSEHNQAVGSKNQLEMYQRRELAANASGRLQTPLPPDSNVVEQEAKLMAQQAAQRLQATAPAVTPEPPILSTQPPPPPPVSSVHVVVPPPLPPDAPPPLTEMQKKALSLPSIAKVMEYKKDFGFVVIGAGSKKGLAEKQSYAIRRGNAIVGQIKLSTVEEATAVGDLDPASIPPGVTIEVGDEVVNVPTGS